MIVYSIVPPRRSLSDKDDPWDADAVHYLLRAGGRARGWSYTSLFGCLRERPGELRRIPHGVETSSNLAGHFGVEKRVEEVGERRLIRLHRTDPLAPAYPVSAYERRTLLRINRSPGEDHRICAVCGHLGVPIVYGMFTRPYEPASRGEVVLGGCCVEPTDLQCVGCGRRWISASASDQMADELLGVYDL